jgi:hypothetical protein
MLHPSSHVWRDTQDLIGGVLVLDVFDQLLIRKAQMA